MRILALITDRANPPTSATRARNFHLWSELKRQGVEVRVLGINLDPKAPFSPGPSQVESDFFLHEREEPLMRALNSVLYSHHQWPFCKKLADCVDAIVREWKPAIIHAEEMRMAAYLPCMRKQKLNSKQSVTLHNVESELILRTGSSAHPVIFRPIIEKIHLQNLLTYEKKIATTVDLCFAYSKLDKKKYEKKYPQGNWAFTSGGARIKENKVAPQINNSNVLIVGTLSYAPNIEGIIWFLTHVKPILPAAVKVTIAGSQASSGFRAQLQRLDAQFIDSPENLDPLYHQHAICAVPLLSGSGTRTKIIEALSYARAVVTTSIGAEGLELANGQGILLADNPELFAKKINLLLENFNERKYIAETGYNHVLKNYDWRYVARNLFEHWSKLANGYYISRN